jgi:hypothetical protein
MQVAQLQHHLLVELAAQEFVLDTLKQGFRSSQLPWCPVASLQTASLWSTGISSWYENLLDNSVFAAVVRQSFINEHE